MKKSDYELKYPTSDELWDSSIIVLDTNVILNLMRIPKEAREDFLKILEELKQSGKLWIPHQVAEEYYRHNEEIKKTHLSQFEEFVNISEDHFAKLKNKLQEKVQKERNKNIDLDKLEQILKTTIDSIKNELNTQKTSALDYDDLFNKIDNIFINVGPDLDESEYIDFLKEGKTRIQFLIPPGYGDRTKADEKKGITTRDCGDYILWSQLINQAKEKETNIIFITDDVKPDWSFEKKIRPELLKEFRGKTGKQICFLSSSNFVYEYKQKQNANNIVDNKEDVNLVLSLREIEQDKRFFFFYDDAIPTKEKTKESFSQLFESMLNDDKNETLEAMKKEAEETESKNVEDIKSIFLEKYDDPHSLLWDSHEGGYQYPNGPFDAYEELCNMFGDEYSDETLQRAAHELEDEHSTLTWIKKD